MKKIAVLGGMAVAIGLAGWSYLMTPTEIEYRALQPEKVETIVEVNTLEVRIKEAQDAAEEEIRDASQRAYDALYEEKMKEVEDSVKTAYIAEIEATISSEEY